MTVLAVLMTMCGLLSAIAGHTMLPKTSMTWPQVFAACWFELMGLAYLVASVVIR